ARVHDERGDARRLDCTSERFERLLRILLVDADAAFDRDRQLDRARHGGDAVADERRLRHQARAEAAPLHPLRRAADIEIDLVVAEIGSDACADGERVRLAAAELECDRMLGRIEGEEADAVAVEHGADGDHLGVDQRATREQEMEERAVPVGPFHHRCNRKPPIDSYAHRIATFHYLTPLYELPISGSFWLVSARFLCENPTA